MNFRAVAALRALCLLGVGAAATLARAGDAAPRFTPQQREHWAFQKVIRPAPPASAMDQRRFRNPIDAFIGASLAELGLPLNPDAERRVLLRRASLDLLGLPPTPAELAAFESDPSPFSFENAVDRMLASPAYGERWARHWLDLARYAESEGFKADETRPNAWRYRDYVIRSFNQDKPYPRFLQEQIAGDELFPGNADALIATGFNRHYPDESNARNLMQRRQEILNDITDTVGAVFSGMTYACARCHDHKTDPILQSDYYRLQAFFANTGAADNLVLASPDQAASHQARLNEWETKTRALRQEMAALEAPHRKAILNDFIEKYPAEIQAALQKPGDQRTAFEWQMVHKAKQYIDPSSHQYIAPASVVAGRLKGDDKRRWESLKKDLAQFASLHPGELAVTAGMTDVAPSAPKTHLLHRGIYDAPKEEITPGYLQILDAQPVSISKSQAAPSSGRRAALAKILSSPDNPLTARVMVNRLWHYHFGRGLVATTSDFGMAAERPSHPELLDWLASEFIQSGWSIKAMHRLIMSSTTYRQSSDNRADAAQRDPDNRRLWRFPRQRLEGESIRDSALAVSGLLDRRMEGPSVFPELPSGMDTRGGWRVPKSEGDHHRRSVYVFVRRNLRYPLFESFDMPDTHESCGRRNLTVNAGQALNLLNSSLSLQWAEHFAGRVYREARGPDREARVNAAFELAFGRSPSSSEQTLARQFFASHTHIVEARWRERAPLSQPAGLNPTHDSERIDGAAMVDFCHMLLNANEFVYRN